MLFGIDTNVIALALLGGLAAGGLIYAFLFNQVANEVKTEKRVKSIQGRQENKRSNASQRIQDAAKRKKSVQDSLKELEDKQNEKRKKSIGIKKQMMQAGLKMTMQQFFVMSFICAIVFAVAALYFGGPVYVVIAAALVGGFGAPRWFVARARKRRMNQFLEEFPNAVDVIVRGVKAGLPINDCLAIIAKEAKDPVRTEFRRIIEQQQMGIPLPLAVQKLYDNMPLTESNFFGIVIAIQQQAGGNLSEALGNLSVVLRDRKKMKQKIIAMSTEAKTSAGIIGALPFMVAFLVYITTPDYIKILWTDTTGNIILVCSGIWMGIGIMVMKKMINFDF